MSELDLFQLPPARDSTPAPQYVLSTYSHARRRLEFGPDGYEVVRTLYISR